MKFIKWKYVVLSVVFLAVTYTACKSVKPEATVEKTTAVETTAVEIRQLAIPIHTSGRLFPGVLAKLSFKTGGIIDKVFVDEGQSVKKGTLLATLDLAEVQAYLQQAQQGVDKANRDKQRVQNLFNDRAATLEQLQNVTTALDAALAGLQIARFNLKHSRIHAPSAGKILKRLVEGNETIAPGYPVFLFGSTDHRWVVNVGVSLSNLIKISPGDRAAIAFDAYPKRTFEAMVSRISEAVDPTSGTCEVELKLSSQPEQLKLIAGFIASVDIFPALQKTYVVVPIDALVDAEGDSGFVYTVENNKARKVKVSIAHLMQDSALLEKTDSAPDAVVTAGAPYLTDGTLVKVIPRR